MMMLLTDFVDPGGAVSPAHPGGLALTRLAAVGIGQRLLLVKATLSSAVTGVWTLKGISGGIGNRL